MRAAVVAHQHRNFSQRIEFVDARIRRGRPADHVFVVDALFGEHDAHFAHVRTAGRAQQFHEYPRFDGCKPLIVSRDRRSILSKPTGQNYPLQLGRLPALSRIALFTTSERTRFGGFSYGTLKYVSDSPFVILAGISLGSNHDFGILPNAP